MNAVVRARKAASSPTIDRPAGRDQQPVQPADRDAVVGGDTGELACLPHR